MAHGGKRPGAGRKATSLARTGNGLKRVEAEEILASIDEKEYWMALLNSTIVTSVAVIYPDGKASEDEPTREVVTVPDSRIRLDAVKYLTDRRDGKPKQAMEHSGAGGEAFVVKVEHIGITHPPTAKTNGAAKATQPHG